MEYFTGEELAYISNYDNRHGTELFDKLFKVAKASNPCGFSLPSWKEISDATFSIGDSRAPRRVIRRVTTIVETETTYVGGVRKKKKKKKKVITEDFECIICCSEGVKLNLECCKQELCIVCYSKVSRCPYCRKEL